MAETTWGSPEHIESLEHRIASQRGHIRSLGRKLHEVNESTRQQRAELRKDAEVNSLREQRAHLLAKIDAQEREIARLTELRNAAEAWARWLQGPALHFPEDSYVKAKARLLTAVAALAGDQPTTTEGR